uniref:Pecanex-like protein n=1 Tax=Ciona savignyi TaxID=51511 RepID=H2YI59_CIOSA
MINSSCDQPIGYPIYVSPLTTSYATTNQQLNKVIGGPITFHYIKDRFNNFINCLQQSCAGSCNSGGSGGFQPANQSIPMVHIAPRNYSNEPIPQLRSLRPSNENARSRHGSLISGEKRARSSVSSSSTIRKLETSFRSNREADNLPSISAISGSSSRSNSTSDNQRPSSSVPRLDSSLRTSSVARSDRFRPTNSFVRLHDPAQNLSSGL